jgi:oligopeptide/dipeptide ABC transporter ATP-binding protein
MLDLRDKYGIPYLFVTHDIAVARYVSDRLAVMYLGRVVEIGETDGVIFDPKHPYTQALLSAVPVPDPTAKHGRIKIKGEIPSAANIPIGCRFRPRCPKAFKDCGWQGNDMVDWLEEKGATAPEGSVAKLVDKMKPDLFVLDLRLKDGESPEALLGALREMASAHSGEPIIQAIRAIDEVKSDKVVEITCRPADLSAKDLASELFAQLSAIIAYKEPDHPMHNVISDMQVQDNVITVTVGGGTKDQVPNVQALLEDYVRHYKKRTRPEFKGVKGIEGDEVKGLVTITCSSAKEPAAKVAKDIAEAIGTTYAASARQGLGGLLLPIKTRRNKVHVRVMGPEDNWARLEKELDEFLKALATSGLRCANAYTGISVRSVRGPKSAVAVKFNTVEEPPLFDTGGGHQVACYLFRPEAR